MKHGLPSRGPYKNNGLFLPQKPSTTNSLVRSEELRAPPISFHCRTPIDLILYRSCAGDLSRHESECSGPMQKVLFPSCSPALLLALTITLPSSAMVPKTLELFRGSIFEAMLCLLH